MESASMAADDDKTFLTVQEAADLRGVSASAIRNWLGENPPRLVADAHTAGGSPLFRRASVLAVPRRPPGRQPRPTPAEVEVDDEQDDTPGDPDHGG